MARTVTWMGRGIVVALAAGSFACGTAHGVEPFAFSGDRHPGDELAHLDRLIGDTRIVLLGENGHGVREFTEAKVEIIRWLHRDHGFDLVIFESGLRAGSSTRSSTSTR